MYIPLIISPQTGLSTGDGEQEEALKLPQVEGLTKAVHDFCLFAAFKVSCAIDDATDVTYPHIA